MKNLMITNSMLESLNENFEKGIQEKLGLQDPLNMK